MEKRNLRTRTNNISYKETTTRKASTISSTVNRNQLATLQAPSNSQHLQSTDNTSSAKHSTAPRTSLQRRTSLTQLTTTLTQPSIARKSSSKRTSISSTAQSATNNRSSISRTANPSPVNQNNTLSGKIGSIESRIKNIEDSTNQESRFETIETALGQLRSENTELRLTIERLKTDIESLQFVTAQLCALNTEFQETKDSCTHLSAENVSIKNTISELRTEVNDLRLELTTNSNKQNLNNDQGTSIISENLTAQLKQEVSSLKSQLHHFEQTQLLAEKGISLEQQELNSNIVIRGIDIVEKGNDSESELIGFYDNIRTHLGIFETSDFKAVSAKILSAKPNPSNKTNPTTAKTIQVCLSSAQIKRQFLQIRRIKKDIIPADIGLTQTSKKPILITEQLTRQNQELLFNARSLRTTSNFKFVWSNDGQILARQYTGSKVLRIRDIDHIKSLRNVTQSQLPQNE